MLDEHAALRAALGPVAEVKDLNAEKRVLETALEVVNGRSALVADAAAAALAAGATDVRVSGYEHALGYGARVVAPGAPDGLAAALGRLGKVERERDAFRVEVDLPGRAALRKLAERIVK
jgi:hypothetical protein